MTAEKSLMSDQDLQTLSDLSIYNCTRFGPYTAIIYEDHQDVREYTNMHIAREAAQLATGLQTLGIDKGDRVIVMMINCPEVIISYQTIARAGGVIIPVMPLLKPQEVRYIAENSAARAIITSPILLPLLRGSLATLPTMQHIIVTGDVENVESTGDPVTPRVHAYSDIVAKGASSAEGFLTPAQDGSAQDIAV